MPSQPSPGPGRGRTVPARDRVSADALARAEVVARQTRHPLLESVVELGLAAERQALDSALMDAYRALGSVAAYTLLVELNLRPFTLVAARLLRMSGSRADPQDIVQEAFLAIYRYPTRFCPDKTNAFRNWSYSILRNTVYRSLNKDSREGVPADLLADVLEDTNAPSPLNESVEVEERARAQRVYGLLLMLYLHAFETELKARDRQALMLVEVQGLGYREAADELGIKLENFKMVVCRARKKIHQFMVRVLGTRMP